MNFDLLRKAIFALAVLSLAFAAKKKNHDTQSQNIDAVLPSRGNSVQPMKPVRHGCSPQEPLKPIQNIYCDVESGVWKVSLPEASNKTVGCLLGGQHRCQTVTAVPTADEILPSIPPPNSPDEKYHRLVTIAEKAVPTTWWRQGFDNDRFMFTRNTAELPRQQLFMHHPQNAKLHNMYNCATKESFIRMSFSGSTETDDAACSSVDPNLTEFHALWKTHHTTLGGSDPETKSALLQSATEVIQLFLDLFGKNTIGCTAIQEKINCRGALAGEKYFLCVSSFISKQSFQCTILLSHLSCGTGQRGALSHSGGGQAPLFS